MQTQSINDRVIGLVMALFSAIFLFMALKLPGAPPGFPVGSSTFPTMLGGLLLLLSLLLVVRRPVRATPGTAFWKVRIGLGMLATLVYIYTVMSVGIWVSTFLLLFVYALLLRRSKPTWLETLLLPFGSASLAYGLLVLLDVPMPESLLF